MLASTRLESPGEPFKALPDPVLLAVCVDPDHDLPDTRNSQREIAVSRGNDNAFALASLGSSEVLGQVHCDRELVAVKLEVCIRGILPDPPLVRLQCGHFLIGPLKCFVGVRSLEFRNFLTLPKPFITSFCKH